MPDGRANLDKAPPGPPEMQTRPATSRLADVRDQQQGGPTAVPGMGGVNGIAQQMMSLEQQLTSLSGLLPQAAPLIEQFRNAMRQVAIGVMQSQSSPQPAPSGGGLAGIVAPPSPMSPPAMGGMGMPAPPLA